MDKKLNKKLLLQQYYAKYLIRFSYKVLFSIIEDSNNIYKISLLTTLTEGNYMNIKSYILKHKNLGIFSLKAFITKKPLKILNIKFYLNIFKNNKKKKFQKIKILYPIISGFICLLNGYIVYCSKVCFQAYYIRKFYAVYKGRIKLVTQKMLSNKKKIKINKKFKNKKNFKRLNAFSFLNIQICMRSIKKRKKKVEFQFFKQQNKYYFLINRQKRQTFRKVYIKKRIYKHRKNFKKIIRFYYDDLELVDNLRFKNKCESYNSLKLHAKKK